MESTLFTELTTNEEANLSGGINRSFNGNNLSVGNTALALNVSAPVVIGNGNRARRTTSGNVFTLQSAEANAGNIDD